MFLFYKNCFTFNSSSIKYKIFQYSTKPFSFQSLASSISPDFPSSRLAFSISLILRSLNLAFSPIQIFSVWHSQYVQFCALQIWHSQQVQLFILLRHSQKVCSANLQIGILNKSVLSCYLLVSAAPLV